MIVNGKTRTCGLIGDPVEHTLSPVIHNTLSELFGINMVYVPFHVLSDNVKEAVNGAYALNILGMNATVPHKSAVIPHLKDVDDLASKIGAVNTLVRVNDGYKGYNTDMNGLLRAMQSEDIQIKDETVVLLGAGGAARAVAFLCVNEGASKVYIANRTVEKAALVAKEVNSAFGVNLVKAISIEEAGLIEETSVLAIQCTSVGLAPNNEEVVTSDEKLYEKIHTGVDLIYNPYETKFMKLVKNHGGKVMNGLKMLLYQGIIAYELWNDVSITQEQAMIVLQKMKEEMGI